MLLTQFGLNFKCKVKARSRQGHGNVKARSRQGQGKFKTSSRRGLGKVKERSRSIYLEIAWKQSSLEIILK